MISRQQETVMKGERLRLDQHPTKATTTRRYSSPLKTKTRMLTGFKSPNSPTRATHSLCSWQRRPKRLVVWEAKLAAILVWWWQNLRSQKSEGDQKRINPTKGRLSRTRLVKTSRKMNRPQDQRGSMNQTQGPNPTSARLPKWRG